MSCWVCGFVAPGGAIVSTDRWIVDHCVGPLGVGTLIVRPHRHVERVGDLDDAEALELGPLLQRAAAVVDELIRPSQVYVCLWSHQGREPGHIHFVVQPVTNELITRYDLHGPSLQKAMFDAREQQSGDEMAAFAETARTVW
jgi:diadenosine tetraphosphate (Ap4A) HIT family hydrolase